MSWRFMWPILAAAALAVSACGSSGGGDSASKPICVEDSPDFDQAACDQCREDLYDCSQPSCGRTSWIWTECIESHRAECEDAVDWKSFKACADAACTTEVANHRSCLRSHCSAWSACIDA